MATTQATLDAQYGVHDYALGDLLRRGAKGKLHLRECPFCAADPNRLRYHFEEQESRPDHIIDEHAEEEWIWERLT